MRIKIEVDCCGCDAVGEVLEEIRFVKIVGYGDALIREGHYITTPPGWRVASWGRLMCPKHDPEDD